ncbi:YjbQ family protein [bacterium]|nr:MAG: YjbQ family protein [bacterium]
MMVKTSYIEFDTRGTDHIVDITDRIREIVKNSGINSGIVTVFVPGSTGGITTTEYEPGLLKDLPKAFERLAPEKEYYHHNETWHDGNGFSHVRASLIGPSITIPFVNGELILGTWQQVIFCEFDIRPRRRRLVVQLVGD